MLAAAAWAGVGAATAEPSPARLNGAYSSTSAVGSTARHEHQRLVLVIHSLRNVNVDVGPKGDSPGDVFMWKHRIYNRAETKAVGEAATRCELGIGDNMSCAATWRLDGRGKLILGGTVFGPNDHVVAITGGTGEFVGVGGSAGGSLLRDGGCCGIFRWVINLVR